VHPRVAMCPVAMNPASLQRWAPVLPHVLWLRTSPPCRDGLWCCHVSYGSGSCQLAQEGSGAATCLMALGLASLPRRALALPRVPWLWTLPPCGEGSSAAMCLVVSCGPRVSSIKKGLAGLAMWVSSCVPKARSCVSVAPAPKQLWPVRHAGMQHHYGMQDMRTDDYNATPTLFTAHKTQLQ
jgi:hypothetical protein